MTFSVLSDAKSAHRLLEIVCQMYPASDPLVISDRFGIILAANDQAIALFQLPGDFAGKINLQEFINANAHLVTENGKEKPKSKTSTQDSIFSYSVKKITFESNEFFSFRIVPKFFKPSEAFLPEHGPAYHDIFEATDLAICVLASTGEILEANHRALSLVREEKNQVIGRKLSRILDLNAHEKQFLNSQLEKTIEGETPRFEWWVKAPDGESTSLNITLKSGFFAGRQVIILSAASIFDKLNAEKNILFRNHQLEFVNYLLSNLGSFKNTEEILRYTVDQLIEKSDVIGGGIYYFEPNKNLLTLTTSCGIFADLVSLQSEIPVKQDLLAGLNGKMTKSTIKGITALFQNLFPSQALVVMPVCTDSEVLALSLLFLKGPQKVTPSFIALIDSIGTGIGNYLSKLKLHQELSVSQSRYQALFESSYDAILLLSNNMVVDCNDTTVQLFGYQKHELLGKRPEELSPTTQTGIQQKGPDVTNIFEATMETGISQSFEWKIRHKSGALLDTETSLSRITLDGQVYIQANLRDITERKLAQAALRREEVMRESMQQFRVFLEKVNLSYISLNTKGNIVAVNDYFLTYTGYTREEVIGRNYFDVFLPEEEKELRKKDFARSLEEKVLSHYYEREIITKSGLIKVLKWHSIFEKDTDGHITGLTSVGKDITDRKVAMEALKDNKTRLQDLFDNAHDLIQNTSPDNKFIFVNKAWKEKLGYDDFDIEKLTLNDIVHPYYKAKLIYQLRNLYKGEDVNKIETVFLTKSGKPVHLIGSITCNWHEGKAVAARAILHDITDRIKAERLQKVYYSIANLAISSKDLTSLYGAIHRELSKIIETNNIYIALCDDRKTELNFVYLVDQYMHSPDGVYSTPFDRGIPEYIIRTGRPHYLLKEDIIELVENGRVISRGPIPEVILCSPLSIEDRIIGVITVQDYKKADAYVHTDIEILHFISNQVALAIERKRNEEQINKQNARLKAVFESGSHMMWAVNRSMQITSYNQNFLNSFVEPEQRESHELQPYNAINLANLNPELAQELKQHYQEAFKGRTQHFEIGLGKNGHKMEWREIYLNPIYLQDGTFEEVSGIALDITEKKISQLALSKNEEKFRTIFESFQDLYYRTDAQGFMQLVSPSVKEMLGYNSEDIVGMPASKFYFNPEEKLKLEEALNRHGKVRNFEISLRTKGGRLRKALLNARLITTEFGIYGGMEGVARDVTELKQIEMELIRAKELAESSLEAKTLFLANMSHELRTPMNGIIGMIDLMSQTTISEEQTEYLDTLRKSSDALLAILNDILDLSKIQAGKLVINESGFDLYYTLDKIYSLFSNRANQKDIRFLLHIDPETPRFIETDETRFLQILSNLTSNAIKFTNSGEVNIYVRKKAQTGEKIMLEIKVQDSGIGISEEGKQKLFTNFTQLDDTSTKSFGGTGLGLAISKQLSELLGGEIGLDSVYGQGSTFWFTITCREASNVEEIIANLQALKDAATATEFFEDEPYVLLVDDNSINQKVALQLLTKLGCRCDVASNGYEAIDLAAVNPYQVIFMDIQMPEIDGVATTAEIKKILKEKCPPIIAMTAYSMKDDAEKFMNQGLDDYISKPVKSADLFRIIRKWLNGENAAEIQAPQVESKKEIPLDVAVLKQLQELGGIDFAAQLYADFENEAGDLLKEAKIEVENKHYKEILSTLHQIKGTASTLGINPMAQMAKQLEHEIKAERLETVPAGFDKLLGYFEQFTLTYKQYFTQN